MHNHQTIKCSCGSIIMQCRCMSLDKVVQIEQGGCPDCKKKAALVSQSTISINVYAHGDEDTLYEKGQTLGFEEDSLERFSRNLYEVELTLSVNTLTGDGTITHVDGREVAPKQ